MFWTITSYFILTWSLFLYTPVTSSAELLVRVFDEHGNSLPCRAWVDSDTQRLFRPGRPSTCTVYARDQSFSCDGWFGIEVPPGEVIIHAERGKEYLPVNHRLEVKEGQRHEIDLKLRRWINMPVEGWYSSDMHVHMGADYPAVLRQLALADDVHITPVFNSWLRGTEKSWPSTWPEETRIDTEVVDRNHLITRKNLEIERIDRGAVPGGSVGATFLFGLTRPVTAERFGEHFPTDTSLCLAARRRSPNCVIDTDKPSWAETVVGMALGIYDTVQVCHNHYHRLQTIPGGWGMIGPLEKNESNAIEGDGLFHRTNDLYYRFLNCGFRLGVSGGSAIGVMPVPMGYSRVYAHVDGPLSVEKFWETVKKGNSFATSGPMLIMNVDGAPMGSLIRRSVTDTSYLLANIQIRSIDHLESLHLIENGEVARELDLRDLPADALLDHSVSWNFLPKESSWLAARVQFRSEDGHLRQAHTSPVYIQIDNKPIVVTRDAKYMIRWIDRLLDIANEAGRFPNVKDRDQVKMTFLKAREIYVGIADR